VELLVVIAIIGVLVSLMLPAIQASRETARRSSCVNNLRQLAMALSEYQFKHERLPAGVTNPSGPVRNVPEGNHLSWIVRILPELDEGARAANVDDSVGAYHARNDSVRQTCIGLLNCPSYPGVGGPISCYAGVHHHRERPIDENNRGVLFLNSKLTADDLSDGASYTLLVGEKSVRGYQDLGWMSGTAATLRNAGGPLNRDKSSIGTGASSSADELAPVWWSQNASLAGVEPWTAADYEMRDGESYGPEEEAAAVGADPQAALDDAPKTEEEAAIKPPAEDSDEQEPAPSESAEKSPDADAKPADPLIASGGNPALPLFVGGFGSDHAGLVNFAFADGTVRTLSDSIAKGVLQRLANRNDGHVVDLGDFQQ
jgi:type II secretory pathway pseudopilin PulG